VDEADLRALRVLADLRGPPYVRGRSRRSVKGADGRGR
jgi:hypothetical protein